MLQFSQISLNRLTCSSAICFTSCFLLTVQEMHAQPPSLSPDCTQYEGRHLEPKVISPFGQEHARQQHEHFVDIQLSWSHWVILPCSQPHSSPPQPCPLPSCWLACAWAGPTAQTTPATTIPQPPRPGLSKSHQPCPGPVASLMLAPSHVLCSLSHCSPLALLETDATTDWQPWVKDAAMMSQN